MSEEVVFNYFSRPLSAGLCDILSLPERKYAKNLVLTFCRRGNKQVINPKNSELAVWRFKQLNFQNGLILCLLPRVKADAPSTLERFNTKLLNHCSSFGRGLRLPKTDTLLQLFVESSSQYAEAFPMKSQPRPLAFWQRDKQVVRSVIQFLGRLESSLLLSLRLKKEGGETFRFQRNFVIKGVRS